MMRAQHKHTVMLRQLSFFTSKQHIYVTTYARFIYSAPCRHR